MYLAAMQKPSYRTIIRFRTRFFDDLISFFEQIIHICQELDLIGLNHIAFDGSKIKANASPKKTMNEKQLEKRIKKLLKISTRTDEEEDEVFGTGSPFLIPEELAEDPDLMKKIEQLANAHSCLKESGEKRINLTDKDANVMKSKQTLIPAYNLQTAVDDKLHVIVAADVTTEETDYHQLIPMVEQVVHNTNHKPNVLSADPGYATYENYEFLNENGLNGLIPDNMHFIDTHGKPKYFTKSRFRYVEEGDFYYCPAGRRMDFLRIQRDNKKQSLRLYGGNCFWCPIQLDCTKASSRTITRHPKESLKDEMRQKLATPFGKEEYAKRITVAEAPFGNLKYNKRWTHLSHRGLKKAKGECLLHVIGHNLGVIYRNIPIERVENLNQMRGSLKSGMDSVGDGLFSSFLPERVGTEGDNFAKNEFQIIESGFAM